MLRHRIRTLIATGVATLTLGLMTAPAAQAVPDTFDRWESGSGQRSTGHNTTASGSTKDAVSEAVDKTRSILPTLSVTKSTFTDLVSKVEALSAVEVDEYVSRLADKELETLGSHANSGSSQEWTVLRIRFANAVIAKASEATLTRFDRVPSFVQPKLKNDARTEWKPVPAGWTLYGTEGRPSLEHMDQRALADCYLYAELGAVAGTNPSFLKNRITELPEAPGRYKVTLYLPDNTPVDIHVTTHLPVSKGTSMWWATYGGASNAGTGYWMGLYEKAYAQFKGGYSKLENPWWSGSALQTLVGQESRREGMFSPQGGSLPSLDQLAKWKTEKKPVVVSTHAGWLYSLAHLFGSGNPGQVYSLKSNGKGGYERDKKGDYFHLNHEYVVESVDTVNKTLVLVNPWGTDETWQKEQFRIEVTEADYKDVIMDAATVPLPPAPEPAASTPTPTTHTAQADPTDHPQAAQQTPARTEVSAPSSQPQTPDRTSRLPLLGGSAQQQEQHVGTGRLFHTQRLSDGFLVKSQGRPGGPRAGQVDGNGTELRIVCQAHGPAEDGQPYTVWDRLEDGTWVYDFYTTTPGNGFDVGMRDSAHPQASGLPLCPGWN
ncbi:C2 family cysteine protease [Kitasatospora sp. NPDC004240]